MSKLQNYIKKQKARLADFNEADEMLEELNAAKASLVSTRKAIQQAEVDKGEAFEALAAADTEYKSFIAKAHAEAEAIKVAAEETRVSIIENATKDAENITAEAEAELKSLKKSIATSRKTYNKLLENTAAKQDELASVTEALDKAKSKLKGLFE